MQYIHTTILHSSIIHYGHGSKKGIRNTKMAHGRNAFKRGVLQSYRASVWQPLHSHQSIGEETWANQWRRGPPTIRTTSYEVTASRQTAASISTVTAFCKEFCPKEARTAIWTSLLRTLRNRLKSARYASRGVIKHPYWQIVIGEYVWHSVGHKEHKLWVLGEECISRTDGRVGVWKQINMAYTLYLTVTCIWSPYMAI